MENEFVTYEQALKLNDLGYDGNTICVYNSYEQLKGVISSSTDGDNIKRDKWENRVRAPLKQQVFRWFREKHRIFSYPNRTVDNQGVWYYFVIDGRRTNVVEGSTSFDDAESKCIDLLIKIKQYEIKN